MIPLSDWFTPVLLGDWTIHGGGELLLIAASAGAFGMGLSDIAAGLSDRISGGGDDDEPEFGGDDDFGGGGGFGDDEFGGFDDGDGDDLDEWSGEEGLDDFGGDGGGGANSDLEPRLDDLENEVATISSTMGTVRSENEAINETVEDIEDNIRKLLDIYEMVTRGVNPFVDDAQASGGMGGSFGLFDDADDDGFDDLDPDVADADADSFFDDDFDADSFDEEEGFEGDDFPTGDDDTSPDGVDHGTADEGVAPAAAGDGSADGDEGKTFDELKSEYETGAADWDADDEPEADTDASVPGQEPEESTDADDAAPPEGVETAPDPADLGGAEAAAEPTESSPESEATAEDASESSGGADRREGTSDASTAADEKPYLESLPSGYGAELLVVEWLTYLRGRSSTSEALRAINYYRNIGWIGAPAANSLQEYLSGLAGGEVTPASTGGTQLSIDHHTDSLRYIGKLCGKHVDVERLEWSGSGRDGGRIERRGQRGIQR